MVDYLDLHCDTALHLYNKGASLLSNDLAVSIDKLEKYDRKAQVFAVWCPEGMTDDECYINFRRCAAYFKEQINQNSDKACLCTARDQFNSVFDSGKLAAVLAVEGARLLNGDIERLDVLYETGVRCLTLGWKGETCVCGGYDTESGLTDFGFKVLNRCEELGVMVDVSHLSERAFWDVAGKASRPFMASHSNSFALCPHKRNITDMQFRTIVSSGGVVGVNFVGPHLSKDLCLKEASSQQVYDVLRGHIDHFMSISPESVMLGSDFDGTPPLPGLENPETLLDFIKGKY